MNIQIQNIPEIKPLTQWVEISLPKDTKDSVGYLVIPGSDKQYAQIIDNTLYIKASVKDLGAIKGSYQDDPSLKPLPFVTSNWITDDITEIMPSFILTYIDPNDGFTKTVISNELKFSLSMPQDVTDSITVKSKENNIKMSFSSTFVFKGVDILIHMDSAIYSGQDILPFSLAVESKTGKEIQIVSLVMNCREEIVIDDHRIHGLEKSYLGAGRWAAQVLLNSYVGPEDKGASGVLLCRSAKDFDRDRLLVLNSRSNGRLVGRTI